MPQLQLSPPKIERMDQMAIQAPIWTPPQTPVACPKSQSVPIGVENPIEVPKAATDAQVKIEDLASPFGMDHHSDTVIASPNALENTYFGHDELYVRENDSWHAVPYTSSFTEQYNLVTEAAKQGLVNI